MELIDQFTSAIAKFEEERKLKDVYYAQIRDRYENIAGYNLKMFSTYSKDDSSQTKTDKSKSKAHGEVFTPMWLVDEMVETAIEPGYQDKVWMDMCSGYGAFSIRLLQKVYEDGEDVKTFLEDKLMLAEYQVSSAVKLLYIFGPNVNLYIGDSLTLEEDMDPGIWMEAGGKWHKVKKDWVKRAHKLLDDDFETNRDKVIDKLMQFKAKKR